MGTSGEGEGKNADLHTSTPEQCTGMARVVEGVTWCVIVYQGIELQRERKRGK